MFPSQDAIITHSHTPSHPTMQYSPYNVGPRYCNAHPTPTSPFAWCQPNGAGGWVGLSVPLQGQDRDSRLEPPMGPESSGKQGIREIRHAGSESVWHGVDSV